MQTHTEISRQGANLFSAEQVAKTIGADPQGDGRGMACYKAGGFLQRAGEA